jgi:predicted enzyme related to lactoylglutathione lyase
VKALPLLPQAGVPGGTVFDIRLQLGDHNRVWQDHKDGELNMPEIYPARFAFLKLVVPDLQAAARFYREVFGYGEGRYVASTIADRPMEEFIFPRPEGGTELILLAYTDGATPSPSGVIAGFATPDLEAFQARVLGAGGSVVQEIKPLGAGGRFAFFADPAGYVMEVIER